ncbi:MAG: S1C family serine protease [Pirellulales bacterium]
MSRLRLRLTACALVAAGVLFGSFPGLVPPRVASAQSAAELTPKQRAELYDVLARQVAEFEKQTSFVKTVVKLVGPTVVHIKAEQGRGSRASRETGRYVEEAGSGVIIQENEKYYVLTSRHVIKDAPPEQIKIGLADGRQTQPVKIWSDRDTDIAVIAISAPGLVASRIGNSDKLEIGDFVLAVGSPFGLSHSVTYGIISAKGRRDLQLGSNEVRFQDFLQTDAAINPGNSGGPLINLRGEVIGINTAIASNSGGNEGIGFATPINMVMIIARQLIERGSVVRAYLGVNLDREFGPVMAAEIGLQVPRGARINAVTPASPAEAAKLRVGDVILEFDGVRVDDDDHLVNLVSLTPVGKQVPVLVFRDRQSLTIPVTVGNRARFEGGARE